MKSTQDNPQRVAVYRLLRLRWTPPVLAILLLVGCQNTDKPSRTRPNAAPAEPEAAPAPIVSVGTSRSQSGDIAASARILPAHLKAEVYLVRPEAGRLETIDSEALDRSGGSPKAMLGALSEVGSARILYQFDQPVDLAYDKVQIKSEEPNVTSSRSMPNGQPFNTVLCQTVGITIELSATAPQEVRRSSRTAIEVAVELTVLVPSDVETMPGQKLSLTQTLSLTHQEFMEPGRPGVMIAGFLRAQGLNRSSPRSMWCDTSLIPDEVGYSSVPSGFAHVC